jgi:predicted MFS family arabinose efflux permease
MLPAGYDQVAWLSRERYGVACMTIFPIYGIKILASNNFPGRIAQQAKARLVLAVFLLLTSLNMRWIKPLEQFLEVMVALWLFEVICKPTSRSVDRRLM